jgi:hypothetical protein
MKTCPTCSRTYADETLSYCLADGALLSASYDPEATMILPDIQAKNAPTEVRAHAQPIRPSVKPHIIYAIAALLAIFVTIVGLMMWGRLGTKPNSSLETQVTKPSVSPFMPTPVPKVETKELVVPAREMWVDTGIVLTKGAKLNIYASGRWSDGGKPVRFWGPNGTGNSWPGTLSDAANLDALIGKVGDATFLVGESYSGSCPQSGRLFLSMNDFPGYFSNNSGAIKVKISYNPD